RHWNNQLGTQLLPAHQRERVKLTPEGMTYYQRAKDVLSNLQALEQSTWHPASTSAPTRTGQTHARRHDLLST
ncbi:hypothetical protein VS884_26210, partial [Escherichia coli]